MSGLIVLFKIDKCIKIYFYGTSLSFGLTISQIVECSEKPAFDTKKVTKRRPKFQGEK